LTDARELIDLCAERLVRKTRYKVPIGDHIWDVDEFSDANAPLLLAEVELDSETEAFELPPWLGPEVTQDLRFANYSLACSPYSHWCE
jgi:adenylate cyclase